MNRLMDYSDLARELRVSGRECARVWLWRWNRRFPEHKIPRPKPGRVWLSDFVRAVTGASDGRA